MATTRPAPIFVCPTSEFPICPVGSPTSGPWVISVACGQSDHMRSKFGVSAKAGALALVWSDRPHPSRMHKTTGVWVLINLLLPDWGRSSVLRGRGEALKQGALRQMKHRRVTFARFVTACCLLPALATCAVATGHSARLT